jgi:heme/copper-type cytochrome/quinol oxidase subunit 2
MFELFSEIAVEVLVSMLEIAFDDNSDRDDVSVELETLVIVVVSISLSNDEVECACDIDGSTDFDIYSLVVSIFGVIVLAIWLVGRSDSIDDIRSVSEVNLMLTVDVSEDIKPLFTVVTLKVFIVVVSVVIRDDEGKEDDSVSFEFEVESVGTERVSWWVATIETVDDGNDDDTVEVTTLSVVID